MKLKSFLQLVEIQTKLASMLPLTLGTLYSVLKYGKFNVVNFILLFTSLLIFDMTTTAINNYYDYKRAIKKHGYGYESHNAIVNYGLKEGSVVFVIVTMLVISSITGFLLYLQTDIVILLIGILSFAVGILYSFGPLPISRTPFGEIFSGFFMGCIIIILSSYIHIQDLGFVVLNLNNYILNINLDLIWALSILLFSIPSVAGISNIMLANNICDMNDDLVNKRYTLPNLIGKDSSLRLFKIVYIFGFITIIATVVLGIMPIIYIFSVVAAVPVMKNVKIFTKLQSKKDTFVLSVKNFMIMSLFQIIFLGVACIIYLF